MHPANGRHLRNFAGLMRARGAMRADTENADPHVPGYRLRRVDLKQPRSIGCRESRMLGRSRASKLA